MKQLETLDNTQLYSWIEKAHQEGKKGKLPRYIPLLQQKNSADLSLRIIGGEKNIFVSGNQEVTFPLMSVIKPFTLLYLLAHFGSEFVFTKVKQEASDYPFNSLEHQFTDEGFPKNPMINSGAITLAALLLGENSSSCCENLRLWLNQQGNCQLFLDKEMLNSVQEKPNKINQEIARQLAEKGYFNNPEKALTTYEYICCLSGTIIDLANLGLLLLNPPPTLNKKYSDIVQQLMTTCGLYEASKNFADTVGFPTKSGVSGTILSIVPEQGVIACYSPPLNEEGNSIAGLFLLEKISQYLHI